jgi:speckle-type POZ protein
MGIGKFISSNTFSVGGCEWTIRLCPDGNADADAEQSSNGGALSAFLRLEGGAAGARVKFAF